MRSAVAHLDQRPNHAQAGQPQVFKGPRLGDGVEEGVEEQGDVGCGNMGERQGGRVGGLLWEGG